MGYKALFVDADGTLLDRNRRISAANAAAIRRCAAAGIYVVICSGRSNLNIAEFTDELIMEGDIYSIAFNGCLLCRNGEIIDRSLLPKATALFVIGAIRRADITAIAYNAPDFTMIERETPYTKSYYSVTRIPHKVVGSFEDELADEIPKILAMAERPALDKLAAEMSAFAEGRFNYFSSSDHLLEFCAPNATKGAGMARLAAILGIPLGEAAAIGDYENDLTMIQAAGLGGAPANAIDAVKRAADVVTEADCDHSAVAEFIERYILNG